MGRGGSSAAAGRRLRARRVSSMSEGQATTGPARERQSSSPDDGATTGASSRSTRPIVYRYADQVRGDVSRPLAYVPEVAVTLDRAIEYAPARTPLVRQLRVELRSAATAPRDVRVTLRLPAGLRADSRDARRVDAAGVRRACAARRSPCAASFRRAATRSPPWREANGEAFHATATRPSSTITSGRSGSIATRGRDRGGGPQGAGRCRHRVHPGRRRQLGAPCSQQLGLRVTVLDPADIPKTDLSPLQRRSSWARARTSRTTRSWRTTPRCSTT